MVLLDGICGIVSGVHIVGVGIVGIGISGVGINVIIVVVIGGGGGISGVCSVGCCITQQITHLREMWKT